MQYINLLHHARKWVTASTIHVPEGSFGETLRSALDQVPECVVACRDLKIQFEELFHDGADDIASPPKMTTVGTLEITGLMVLLHTKRGPQANDLKHAVRACVSYHGGHLWLDTELLFTSQMVREFLSDRKSWRSLYSKQFSVKLHYRDQVPMLGYRSDYCNFDFSIANGTDNIKYFRELMRLGDWCHSDVDKDYSTRVSKGIVIEMIHDISDVRISRKETNLDLID